MAPSSVSYRFEISSSRAGFSSHSLGKNPSRSTGATNLVSFPLVRQNVDGIYSYQRAGSLRPRLRLAIHAPKINKLKRAPEFRLTLFGDIGSVFIMAVVGVVFTLPVIIIPKFQIGSAH